MVPYVQIIKPFPDFEHIEVGQNFEINCAFSLEGDTHISVVGLHGESDVSHLDITTDLFNEHYVICGDLESIWEDV